MNVAMFENIISTWYIQLIWQLAIIMFFCFVFILVNVLFLLALSQATIKIKFRAIMFSFFKFSSFSLMFRRLERIYRIKKANKVSLPWKKTCKIEEVKITKSWWCAGVESTWQGGIAYPSEITEYSIHNLGVFLFFFFFLLRSN